MACHHLRCDLRKRHTRRFTDKRHRPRGAGIHLKNVQQIVLDRVLNVQESNHFQRPGQPARPFPDLCQMLFRDHVRRQHARAVPGVDPGLLDVLHDAADHHGLAVAHCVHVNFESVFQKAIDQDRVIWRHVNSLPHVVQETCAIVDDLHGPSAQNVRRTNQHGVTDSRSDFLGLLGGHGRAPLGHAQSELLK